jgi:hypothetical protein
VAAYIAKQYGVNKGLKWAMGGRSQSALWYGSTASSYLCIIYNLSTALQEVRDSLLGFDKNAKDIELRIADCHNYEAMRQL